jgi:4-aminobutyrate aminotransferase/(S)-3-amino-2-methylpropionate transaminase
LSTYAKSLGSGLPIAAVVGRAEVMDAAAGGTIGGTYIGSPLSCVAASATIKYMKDLNLNERANEVGKIITDRMLALQTEINDIGDVRGVGAMVGIEFVVDGDPRKQNGELCDRIVRECAENHLIVLSAGTFKNVIRILSPLVITNDQLNQGLDILENAIRNAAQN